MSSVRHDLHSKIDINKVVLKTPNKYILSDNSLWGRLFRFDSSEKRNLDNIRREYNQIMEDIKSEKIN